jgi:hypothetical protein
MLDDDFNKKRAALVRDLASRADPFIKRRLLDLVSRYEKPAIKKQVPLVPVNGKDHPDQKDGDGDPG